MTTEHITPMAQGGIVGKSTQEDTKPPRIISAGTWIRVQDACWYASLATVGITLLGVVVLFAQGRVEAGQSAWWSGLSVAACFFFISWGLDEARMNGLPGEQRLAAWIENRR